MSIRDWRASSPYNPPSSKVEDPAGGALDNNEAVVIASQLGISAEPKAHPGGVTGAALLALDLGDLRALYIMLVERYNLRVISYVAFMLAANLNYMVVAVRGVEGTL